MYELFLAQTVDGHVEDLRPIPISVNRAVKVLPGQPIAFDESRQDLLLQSGQRVVGQLRGKQAPDRDFGSEGSRSRLEPSRSS
jgi:hypothetical protein